MLTFELPKEFSEQLTNNLKEIYTDAIEQAQRDNAINKEYLNAKEACKLLDVANNTLMNWVQNGLIMYKIDNKKYFKRQELYNFIEQHKQ